MLEIIKAILFGIVEGITEWLPVSSTGHMILLNEFVSFSSDKVREGFFEMFDVVIQLGAIMAVVILFWNKIFPFYFGKKAEEKGFVVRKNIFVLWFKIIVSCLPAVVVGLLFDDWVEEHLHNGIVVAIMLILVGVVFILAENIHRDKEYRVNKMKELTYKDALIIGLFQVIAAVLPGTSRSGATIIGALLIGVARPVAAEYTFYLAIPVMFGASLLKVVKFGFPLTGIEIAVLLTGMVVAFLVSFVVIGFFMNYIKKHDFKVFGYYRIVLGAIVLIYFIVKHFAAVS
ncbi:MAG: undecaprenyl-diphosphate phosphatase [Lachnospiraceae bacterium]|nr:undecaprenyl-diphosphate phosphatase [Lachnospiraceae bacterium]